MPDFLADENIPAAAVDAMRAAGLDVKWINEFASGVTDEQVLTLAAAEGRVLLTLDKDFGELAFRQQKTLLSGIVLFRLRLREPEQIAHFMTAILRQDFTWSGHFSVAEEGRLRQTELPK